MYVLGCKSSKWAGIRIKNTSIKILRSNIKYIRNNGSFIIQRVYRFLDNESSSTNEMMKLIYFFVNIVSDGPSSEK